MAVPALFFALPFSFPVMFALSSDLTLPEKQPEGVVESLCGLLDL
jgi:hypothetical protein